MKRQQTPAIDLVITVALIPCPSRRPTVTQIRTFLDARGAEQSNVHPSFLPAAFPPHRLPVTPLCVGRRKKRRRRKRRRRRGSVLVITLSVHERILFLRSIYNT